MWPFFKKLSGLLGSFKNAATPEDRENGLPQKAVVVYMGTAAEDHEPEFYKNIRQSAQKVSPNVQMRTGLGIILLLPPPGFDADEYMQAVIEANTGKGPAGTLEYYVDTREQAEDLIDPEEIESDYGQEAQIPEIGIQ